MIMTVTVTVIVVLVVKVSAGVRVRVRVRPVHLLRVFLLRVLESNFPGDPLSNSTGMRIPTP